MKFFGLNIGTKAEPVVSNEAGDLSITDNTQGIHKAYIPEFLYKPPFGYPRKENLPLIRQLAKNPYVFAVIKTLEDEVASTPFDVVYKDDTQQTAELERKRLEILKFFDNPNKNKESFQHILRAVVRDIAQLDSGIIVKVFNKTDQMVEIFARDGASFLKNPDIYGYMGNRAEYVTPVNINYATTPESPDWSTTLRQYELAFKDAAAYFQYGTTAMALPVPFGRKEIIWFSQNPKAEAIYGESPIQILADIITTLIYGSTYNLDFYMNNNMPEGIIQLIGADKDSIMAFKERFDKQFRVQDKLTGFMRRVGFKFPVVNQEAKFIPFQLDPKVMQILEQQQWFTKLVWSCFGVTADEMGFTQDSNKAVSQTQQAVYKRKAVRPILSLIKYHIDKEIIPEWGPDAFESLEFKWNDYDIEEEIRKNSLYEMQIRMGVKTPEMVAEDLKIDVAELKRQKDEAMDKEIEKYSRQVGVSEQFSNEDTSQKQDPEKKAIDKYANTMLEKTITEQIKKKAKMVEEMLKQQKKGNLDNIQ